MPDAGPRPNLPMVRWLRGVEATRRAFAEFLKLPCIIVSAFMLLAVGTWLLDHAEWTFLQPLRSALRERFFRDSQSTSDLLSTIAGGIITVTSITFSLLLLAVQQAAGALTHQVYDQFLRRRVNQVYFGFFVGLAVYTLVVLASVDRPYNPVFGALMALVLTIVALMLMVLLLYTTVNQMRPTVVIDAIHDRLLLARERQQAWLKATKRVSSVPSLPPAVVRSDRHGYVVRIDFDRLTAAMERSGVRGEIRLMVAIGAFVAFEDPVAEFRPPPSDSESDFAKAVREAIHIEQQRDLDADAAYGIEQLADIAWTSISTAKSNPAPGLLVIHSLRDVMARWSVGDDADSVDAGASIVYEDDVYERLLDALETLTVVASESMQPQTISALLRTFALMFDRLPAGRQAQAEALVLRSLSALGEHVLTRELDAALATMIWAMEASGRGEAAAQVQKAQKALSHSRGKLGSRATRVRGD